MHDDVRVREVVCEEVAADEPQPSLHAVVLDVLLEQIGATSGRSKPTPVRCGLASAICTARSPCAVPTSTKRRVFIPGELLRDRQVGAVAEAGHRARNSFRRAGSA